MISYDSPTARFNFRVAGACLHEGRVLAQTARNMDFHVLPGGRVELTEDSVSALEREMREELGCNVRVGSLLWVVENFFTLEGQDYHEVSLIYEITPEDHRIFAPDWKFRNIPAGEENQLEFRWIPLGSLTSYDLKPEFLRESPGRLPETPEHLVIRE